MGKGIPKGSAHKGSEGNQDLYMINADGTNLVNLTNTPTVDESMPDWSL